MHDEHEGLDGVSRLDFLKGVGLAFGAAGLGATFAGNALAEGDKKGKYVVVITSGANNPNRAIVSLLLAVTAAEKNMGEVHVWMTLEGADLAHKDKAPKIDSPIFKKFGNAESLMKKLKDKGATFGVCPPCAEFAAAVDSAKYDFVEKRGADWLMKNMQDAWVAWM